MVRENSSKFPLMQQLPGVKRQECPYGLRVARIKYRFSIPQAPILTRCPCTDKDYGPRRQGNRI